MPMAKDAFAEYQRNRRKAERPCMICGGKGKATEIHTAAPGAAAIRCCLACKTKIKEFTTPTDSAAAEGNVNPPEIAAPPDWPAAQWDPIPVTPAANGGVADDSRRPRP